MTLFSEIWLSYKASIQAERILLILVFQILSPLLAAIFFWLIRAQQVQNKPEEMFLILILILPLTASIFRLGSTLFKFKQVDFLRVIYLSTSHLFEVLLKQAICVCLIVWASILIVVIGAMSFSLISLSCYETLAILILYLMSTFVACSFGVLVSFLLLMVKERLIVSNTLFYLSIIFSGAYPFDHVFIDLLSYLLPLKAFVTIIQTWIEIGELHGQLLIVGACQGVLYLAISYMLARFLVLKENFIIS